MSADGREGATGFDLMSIGHSTHSIEVFVQILRQFSVAVVADVRSVPYSRFNPQFNRENFQRELRGRGIEYVFLGGQLGGRPEGDEFYDDDRHVCYGCVAGSAWFQTGLDRLKKEARERRVVIMCSEEDPVKCHRYLLVARALEPEHVTHIIRDKRPEGDEEPRPDIVSSKELEQSGIWRDGDCKQMDLFGQESHRGGWRSPSPVPRPGWPSRRTSLDST